MPDGSEVAAHYIFKKGARVPLRGGQVAWFMVDAQVPSDTPIRVYAESDDLPDDEDQAQLDRTFHVRRETST